MVDLRNIATEELVEELQRRKQEEVPRLAKQMNDNLQALKALGVEVNYYNDSFALEKIVVEETEGKLQVFYDDKEI